VPSALRTGIGSALYFGGLNQLRSAVLLHYPGGHAVQIDTGTGKPQRKTLNGTANLLTGAVARALAGFGVMPITVLKVRFESSLYSYPTLRAAARAIYVENGLRGFFAGFGATAVRDAPYAGLYVFFYENIKTRLGFQDGKAHIAGNFGAGVIAAGAATAITNPFDAVKTRIQLHPTVYRNLVGASLKMVREEGWRCLFDGLALRMARKGLSSALAWTVYEEVVRRAEQKLVV
jgi:solute carrier family 25 protein 38